MSLVLKINFSGVNDISGLTFWTTFNQIMLCFVLSGLLSMPEKLNLLCSNMAGDMALCGNLGIYPELKLLGVSEL